MYINRISSLQRWRLGGIYSPLGKTSRFIAVAIPDTSGMTYTAPTVTKLQSICEASELPMNVRTSDRRNSRLTSELPTLNIFENHCNWVKYLRCRNSRYMSELPTVGTSDLRRNSRHSVHLKTVVGLWSSIPDTSGMNTGHVRYDHHSELSKLFKLRDVETPDPCRNSRPMSELPTNQPENNTFTVTGQIPDTSGMARPATSQLALLSLKHSNLTGVGLSTYETLSINMMHPS